MFLQVKKSLLIKFLLVRYKSTTIPSLNSKLNLLLTEMPRDRTHIADAQKQRLRIKEKSARYVPGTVSLQVLGNGASGTPASVYLFTDQTRYLFNCGEGTQRLAHEHKTKLSRLEHIFMTRTSWEHLGGLPGLSLTVQDAGVPNLTLHGPPGLDEIYRGMRRFVVLKDLKVKTVILDNQEVFDDQILNITCVPLKRQIQANSNNCTSQRISPEPELDDTDYYAYETNRGNESTPPPMEEQTWLSNTSKQEESVVVLYICKLKPKPGSLNLEKCVEKGVPPGPLLGQLKNGLEVTLPNGIIVRPDEVRAPTDPGPVFIFLDIPNIQYLQSLCEVSSVFQKYQKNSTDSDSMPLIILHFSPQHIIEEEIYQNFIKQFSTRTKHLILNTTNQFSGYLAAHRIQWQLNQIDENIFPLLKENINFQSPNTTNKKMKLSSDKDNIIDNSLLNGTKRMNFRPNQANSLTTYHLRPRKGLDRNNEPMVNPIEYIQETQIIEGFTKSLEDLKLTLLERHAKPNSSNEYPKLIFLGTGSCIPNKTRNVSSILLHTTDKSCILLDCGEGTWGQIIRFYGEIEAIEILKKLKAIYISHLHADHHIGLIGILRARQIYLNNKLEPLMLLAPKQIQSWLHFYNHRIESISQEYFLISNGDLINTALTNEHTTQMSINSISTCLVSHCPHSFGISIVTTNELSSEIFKITYSGDTMPCNDLIELGMNSTILIHEATMEDELENEAKFKMHSTVSQAIEQGKKMNANYTILTHFSQRYAKLPRIENFIENNVGIAFDNMQVSINDLYCLHNMYPTLKIMFSEHYVELEQKALKRALKNERKRLLSNDKIINNTTE